MYEQSPYKYFEEENRKLRQEMEALWIHIRNLETLLLNPSEVPCINYEYLNLSYKKAVKESSNTSLGGEVVTKSVL